MTAHIGDLVFILKRDLHEGLELRSVLVEAIHWEADGDREFYTVTGGRVVSSSDVFDTEGAARAEARRRFDARKEARA